MGFSISWIGFKGIIKSDVLARVEFQDLLQRDEVQEAAFSLAELPTGWSILFSNDFGFGAAEHLRMFSKNCYTLACQVHEGIMYSAAHHAFDGSDMWSVWHEGDVDLYNVSVSGTAPKTLGEVTALLHAEQDAHGGEDAGVDYSFDIPVDLAFRLTGFRHDHLRVEWGEPYFTVVERRS